MEYEMHEKTSFLELEDPIPAVLLVPAKSSLCQPWEPCEPVLEPFNYPPQQICQGCYALHLREALGWTRAVSFPLILTQRG